MSSQQTAQNVTVDPKQLSKDDLVVLVYELQSQVEALRDATAVNFIADIQSIFRMTSKEAKTVSALLDGIPHSKEAIFSSIYFDSMYDPPEMKIVDVLICKVRKKLFPFSVKVETIWGSGYRLVDHARLRSILGGEIVPDVVVGADPTIRRKRGENAKAVLAVLVSEMDAQGKTTISARLLARKANLKIPLLQIMKGLERNGKIQIKAQPDRNRQTAPWIVHVKARSL